MEDFRLEAQLLADGLPSVEQFQIALLNAYKRGIQEGGRMGFAAIRSAFENMSDNKTEVINE